jgi:hypothetical protein
MGFQIIRVSSVVIWVSRVVIKLMAYRVVTKIIRAIKIIRLMEY